MLRVGLQRADQMPPLPPPPPPPPTPPLLFFLLLLLFPPLLLFFLLLLLLLFLFLHLPSRTPPPPQTKFASLLFIFFKGLCYITSRHLNCPPLISSGVGSDGGWCPLGAGLYIWFDVGGAWETKLREKSENKSAATRPEGFLQVVKKLNLLLCLWICYCFHLHSCKQNLHYLHPVVAERKKAGFVSSPVDTEHKISTFSNPTHWLF